MSKRSEVVVVALCVSLLCAASCVTAQAADESLPPRSAWRAMSSSVEGPGLATAYAIDGDPKTRWGGAFSAGHWFQVDLGRAASVGGVLISWDSGYARKYSIQASLDGKQWRQVFVTEDSPGNLDYVFFPSVKARYVRIAAAKRTADWGVSIFEFEPLSAKEAPKIHGLGDDAAWSPTTPYKLKPAESRIDIHFPRPLPLAGIEITWGSAPASAKLESRDSAGDWSTIAEDPEGAVDNSFLATRAATNVTDLRITTKSKASAAPSIARLRPIAASRALTPFKRYEIAASRAQRELFPSSLRYRQVYWTAVGVPAGRKKSIFDEYGNLEASKGAPLVQPIWRDASGKASAAFDKKLTHSLRAGWMPMPSVEWNIQPGLTMRSEAIAVSHAHSSVTLVRHRIANVGKARVEGKLSLIVRPMQICPPWQNAGPSPIKEIAFDKAENEIRVDGAILVRSLTQVDQAGASGFGRHGEGEVTRHAAAGTVPATLMASDDDGLAAAIMSYSVSLEPGTHRDVVVAFPLGSERVDAKESDYDATANRVAEEWQSRLGRIGISLPDRSLVDMLRAQAAYMLINQTGDAIQPGPRNYNRSFIRDGSATAAVLVRMGMPKVARDYLRWYSSHAVHENGLVSPILNDDGTVNRGFGSDLEHDSQGELIWLIAEIARLDGGASTVRDYQRTVKLALTYLEELRNRTLVPGYQSDREAPERFRGLVAPSISHEGYSTPTHSYWDDYWALKGWHDGAWLAEQWGDMETAKWARAQYAALRASMATSIRATMKWKGADFIPAAADLGDGDPTGVSIGIDPTGQIDLMPLDALKKTFERYLADVRNRDRPGALYAYTPYEMRNVLTYVHLNKPREANELLMTLLRHRRPAEWQVLAEVVYSDLRHAIYLGDMPHTWIGAEYARAIFGMLMHEADDRLRLLPGVPPTWLAADGLSVTDLPTAFGKLTMSARQKGSTLSVSLSSGLRAAAPVEVSWPNRKRPRSVAIDGVAQSDFDADGIRLKKPFATLEAKW